MGRHLHHQRAVCSSQSVQVLHYTFASMQHVCSACSQTAPQISLEASHCVRAVSLQRTNALLPAMGRHLHHQRAVCSSQSVQVLHYTFASMQHVCSACSQTAPQISLEASHRVCAVSLQRTNALLPAMGRHLHHQRAACSSQSVWVLHCTFASMQHVCSSCSQTPPQISLVASHRVCAVSLQRTNALL